MSKERLDRIDDQIKKFGQLKARSITHKELGSANSFLKANEIKNRIADYILDILARGREIVAEFPEQLFDQQLGNIESSINNINHTNDDIDKLASEGVHNENFPKTREALLDSFNSHEDTVHHQLMDLELRTRITEVENKLQANKDIELSEKSQRHLDESVKNAKEIKKILENLRSRIMSKGVEKSQGTFDELRQNHMRRERGWFCALVFSGIVIVAAVAVVLLIENGQDTSSAWLYSIFNRLLIISTPLIAFRLSLSKYNVERNLRIIYDHRATVLKQYQDFENAIGDDTESKNQFRIEIAKFIFSDPQTGYIKDSKSSEVSFNPIINLAEKMASKMTST